MKTDRSLIGPIILLALFLISPITVASAEQDQPVPSYSFGKMTLYTLQDRPGSMPISLFEGIGDTILHEYMPEGQAPASINSFALEHDGEIILFDAGYGDDGPGEGSLFANMEKAGISPERVDYILLTHMHMDHIGGLLIQGKRAFPKARVLVSAPEAEYWLGNHEGANFTLARQVRDAYGKDFVEPFAFGDSPVAGVTAIDASGHTPGHTAYRLKSADQEMLVIGDLIHAAALQFPVPAASGKYDIDPDRASQARERILNLAAEENLPVAGMHLPLPSVGIVIRAEMGGYRFLPNGE